MYIYMLYYNYEYVYIYIYMYVNTINDDITQALGLSTMIAEAVLVRVIVPVLGEKQCK